MYRIWKLVLHKTKRKKKNESFYLLCVYFQPTLYLMFLHFYETTGTV